MLEGPRSASASSESTAPPRLMVTWVRREWLACTRTWFFSQVFTTMSPPWFSTLRRVPWLTLTVVSVANP